MNIKSFPQNCQSCDMPMKNDAAGGGFPILLGGGLPDGGFLSGVDWWSENGAPEKIRTPDP